jgi:uncharacterized membrane protein
MGMQKAGMRKSLSKIRKGKKKVTERSQQKEETEQFQLLADGLFDYYNPESALEEAIVISIARALWMTRTHGEFNSDTRLLNQEINFALGRLYKSKLISPHYAAHVGGCGLNH